jgi:endonuclease/exonuclease/phosphatase family metal-dependent hydrolase
MARRALSLALALTALLALPAGAMAHGDRDDGDRDGGDRVKVMTRNIYLGGDITRPLTATQGKTGLAALLAFGNSNLVLRNIVDQTDFPARAKLLAREIDREEPDLIGLQEVALWRSGPLDLARVGVADAQTVDLDFLAILLQELAARGARYDAIVVQEESDVEGPAFAGNPFTGAGFDPATARDVRLTMRDAILMRRSRDLKLLDKGQGQYAARLNISIGGAPFAFIRGFNWADVKADGERLRFINTHLESQSSLLALLQAGELLAGPASDRSQPVVIACDCNSDPLNHTTKPTDPIPTPHSAAYGALTGSGGFADEWLELRHAGPGFTSGFNELANDPDTTAIDHRIDLVLGRSARGRALKAKDGEIVGVDPRNRTASGLWPSDHAGVVMRLKL